MSILRTVANGGGRSRGFAVVVLALLLAPAASRADTAADNRARLDRADREMRSHEFEAARKDFQAVTDQDPGSMRAWKGLGWSLWSLGQKDKAIKVWTDLLQVRPGEKELLAALAEAYEQDKNWSQALSYYDQVLKIDEGSREARLGRARIYRSQNKLAAAESELKTVLAHSPDDADAEAMMAGIYAETGRLAAARDVMRKLTAHQPLTKYQRSLGELAAKLGDNEEAITQYRKALRMDPNDRSMIAGLARVYAREHRYPEAVQTIQPYLDAHPDDDDLRNDLSAYAAAAGISDVAERQLRELVNKYPREVKWKMKLAQTLHRAGQYDDAIRIAKEILQADPKNVDALTLLASDAYLSGRDGEAIGWYHELSKVDPKADYWIQIGRIYFRRGDKAHDEGRNDEATSELNQAIEAFGRAAALDPKNPDADLGVASSLVLSGRPREAVPVAEKLLGADPVLQRARQELFNAYYDLGEYDRAETELQELRKESPNDVAFENEYAGLLFSAGKRNEAIGLIERDLREPLRPNVPVLLYHGVTPSARENAISVDNFRAQMMELKREGYHPISVKQLVDFLDQKTQLPPKPILITFDDARSDSFRNADPVLKEVGFHATMFVPVGELGQHGAFTATWNTLREMQRSGRWDMQCHAYMAHRNVPIDDQGHKAAFLSARMWLPDQHRTESDEEIHARLDSDYRQCKEILSSQVPGTNVVAFAYPFSDLGQDTLSNNPNALRVNHELAMKYFRVAFVQEMEYVTRLKPRSALPRFEVPRDMTGEELTQTLRDHEPVNALKERLADLYAWSGQFKDAIALYEELKRERVDPAGLLLREGEAYAWMGDFAAGRPLMESAKAADPENMTIAEKVDQLNARFRPMIQGQGLYYSDNSNRSNSSVGPSGRAYLTDRFSLAPRYAYTQFDQRDFNLSLLPSSSQSGTSGGSTTPTTSPTAATPFTIGGTTGTTATPTTAALATGSGSRGHLRAVGNEFEVEGDYTRDWSTGLSLSGGAAEFDNRSSPRVLNDNLSAVPLVSGMATLGLGEQADIAVGGTHSYVGTAGAIIDELTFTGSTVRARWRPLDWLSLNGNHFFNAYSDSNKRNTLIASSLVRIWEVPKVQVGYQFTYDDTQKDNPFFFTPHGLNTHEGVVQLELVREPIFTAGVIATTGVGKQRGGQETVQGSAIGEVHLNVTPRFGLFGTGGRFQAASFTSETGSGGVFFRF